MDESQYESFVTGRRLQNQHTEWDCWETSIKNALLDLAIRVGDPNLSNITLREIKQCLQNRPRYGPPDPEAFEPAFRKFIASYNYLERSDFGDEVTLSDLTELLQKRFTSLPIVSLNCELFREYGIRVENQLDMGEDRVSLEHVVLVLDIDDEWVWFFDPFLGHLRKRPGFKDLGGHVGRAAFEDYWRHTYKPNWYMTIVRSKTPKIDTFPAEGYA
jgi:hypothetical protein